MPPPVPADRLDDAIRRYLIGEPLSHIEAATRVTSSSIHRERARRGIPPRRNLPLPAREIAEKYLAGRSELDLAQEYDVSRGAIRSRLTEGEVTIRGRSEAMRLRAQQMTAEQRRAQANAAHDAWRGTVRSEESMQRAAKRRELFPKSPTDAEHQMWRWCVDKNLFPVREKAIGRYNVDLAVMNTIAVEILGGGWHAIKTKHAKRTPYILDQGWDMLFVWDYEGVSALREDAADYLVTWHEESRRNPTPRGEYRVIAGDGQLLAHGRADSGQFALKPPPRGRFHPRT